MRSWLTCRTLVSSVKVTIVGKRDIYRWDGFVGPFLVHKFWVPSPPPLPSSTSLGAWVPSGPDRRWVFLTEI